MEISKMNAKGSFWEFETGKMFNCHTIGKSCTLLPRNSAGEKNEQQRVLGNKKFTEKVKKAEDFG